MNEPILKVEGLVKRFGNTEVLRGIDLDIRAGEIFGIIGSSGSGKTTLLNSLIGFLAPTRGRILFRDSHLLSYEKAAENSTFRNVLRHPFEVKQMFGFASQDPSVYGKLTLFENLDLFGALFDMHKEERVANANILLKLMGLDKSKNTLAENLSGGMLKRLDIACALMHDPKILILDEPTADLDPFLRKHMWDLIRKIANKGTTIIISSHYLDEIEILCDRIGLIHKGKLEHYGTPTEIKELHDGSEEVHVRTEYKRYDILETKLQAEKDKLNILEMKQNGASFSIRCTDPLLIMQEVVKITEKIEDKLVDMRLNKPSLNEIFAQYVAEHHGDVTEQQHVKHIAPKRFWSSSKTKKEDEAAKPSGSQEKLSPKQPAKDKHQPKKPFTLLQRKKLQGDVNPLQNHAHTPQEPSVETKTTPTTAPQKPPVKKERKPFSLFSRKPKTKPVIEQKHREPRVRKERKPFTNPFAKKNTATSTHTSDLDKRMKEIEDLRKRLEKYRRQL